MLRVHVVLCVHVLSMCARACVLTSDLAIYIFHAHYRLVSRFTGVHFNMVCMNVHQVYSTYCSSLYTYLIVVSLMGEG